MSVWNSPTLGKNLGVLRTANSITQRHTDYKMSFSGGQVSWNANPDTDFTVASGSQHSNSSELRTLKFWLFFSELNLIFLSLLMFGLVFVRIQVNFACCLPRLLWQWFCCWLHTKSLIFAQKGWTLNFRPVTMLYFWYNRSNGMSCLTRVPVDRRKVVFILQVHMTN